MPSEDELAQTATAQGSASSPVEPLPMLGRYRLERELGAGGMGVVHAAFDPDLERTVALKVLRHASGDASTRLLREARAMAKLSHPNVITIFEVGTATGRDYIAMELIDGETLAGWVRSAHLRWRDIVAAFVAAGRGLAAAHVAGLVHRDFKAQNVLRARDGRILVTDFGLACATDEPAQSGSREVPSDRSGTLTATGTLIGTPAYMAPEQWSGGAIGPATDQFSFCVGLWEAVAGERPFRGATLDELRAAVLAGPDKLDDERVPRPLRAILRRGLAIDPARRWPDMSTLLAALQRVLRRRRRVVGTAAIVAIAGGALALALIPRGPAPAGCPPSALDPDQVWSARVVAELGARGGDGVKLLDHDTTQWREVRGRVCAAPLAVRSTKLACLDGVMARIDATVRAVTSEHGPIDGDAVAAELVDPSVCDRATVPHLAAVVGPDLAEAFGLLRSAIVAEHEANLTAAIAKLDAPCARAVALSAKLVGIDTDAPSFPDRVPALLRDEKELFAAAERCDDDAIKARVAVISADDDPAALERAKQAVVAVTTPDLVADLDRIAGAKAREARRWDDATAAFDRGIVAYGGRHRARAQLGIVIDRVKGLLERGRPEDLDAAIALDARWHPVAAKLRDRTLGQLELHTGEARWRRGDVTGGDAALDAATAHVDVDAWIPIDSVKPMDVSGEVVDETGAPVAEATVTSALLLVGDSTRLASPIGRFASRSTRTDRDGRFTLSGVRGTIAAMRGDRRSAPVGVVPHLRLVLHPTSRVSGKVELGGRPAGKIWVVARSEEPGVAPSMVVAPVLGDGSFALEGVPRGRVAIGATEVQKYTFAAKDGFAHIVASAPVVDRIALALAAHGKLYVVARNVEVTPPDGAFVIVARGRIANHHKVFAELAKGAALQVAGARDPATPLPEELRGHAEPDDMYTMFEDRAEGELTVCALGLSKRQMAMVTEAGKLSSLLTDAEFACVVVEPPQAIVTIELPPIRRTVPHGEPTDAGH